MVGSREEMLTNASSSSDDESEVERKRKLREAVFGVNINSAPPKKKVKPSKRISAEQETESNEQVVTKDMQAFLSRKLSEFLDSQYKTVCKSPPSVKPGESSSNVSVKLLSDSRQPISMEKVKSLPSTAQSTPSWNSISNDTESSDSEAETCRLREAAIDSKTILSKR